MFVKGLTYKKGFIGGFNYASDDRWEGREAEYIIYHALQDLYNWKTSEYHERMKEFGRAYALLESNHEIGMAQTVIRADYVDGFMAGIESAIIGD